MFVADRASGGGGGDPDLATLLYLKLSSLVVSATRTVLAPAVPASPGLGDDKTVVLVPLLVFRGESDTTGSPDVEGQSERSTIARDTADLKDVVDVDQVSKALDSMALPDQEIVVVGATHVLSEHPEVCSCAVWYVYSCFLHSPMPRYMHEFCPCH